MGWIDDREEWARWYPADFVTESFPGQFRNWFYALIAESTVMTGRAPARTLFGYALMRDEHGEEMHKSKGNAIWLDDAAEQIGADVMRWMFSATNPKSPKAKSEKAMVVTLNALSNGARRKAVSAVRSASISRFPLRCAAHRSKRSAPSSPRRPRWSPSQRRRCSH